MAEAPVRVMILTNWLGYGGTEKYVISLAKGLDRSKYAVSLCCLEDYAPLSLELVGHDVVWATMGSKHKLDPTALIRLAHLLKAEKTTLLHTNLPYSNVVGYLAARLAGVPILVAGERNTDLDRPTYLRWLSGYAGCHADCVVANSQSTLEWSAEATGIPPERFVVIHNGIDLAGFSPPGKPEREAARRRFGLGNGDLLIGTVGRLHAQKGHRFLIQAIPSILRRYPQARFCIVGEGSLEQDLKQQCQELGVRDRVLFTGARTDVAAIMAALDVFVLPSLWEGFGIVLLEAMAMCLPIVASDVGGIPEVVEPGHTGLLVPPADPTSIAQAVIHLLQDPDLARSMGTAGRRRVEEHFTLADRIMETEQLYDELIAQKAQV